MIIGWYYDKNNKRQPIFTNLPDSQRIVNRKPGIITFCGRDKYNTLVFWNVLVPAAK